MAKDSTAYIRDAILRSSPASLLAAFTSDIMKSLSVPVISENLSTAPAIPAFSKDSGLSFGFADNSASTADSVLAINSPRSLAVSTCPSDLATPFTAASPPRFKPPRSTCASLKASVTILFFLCSCICRKAFELRVGNILRTFSGA